MRSRLLYECVRYRRLATPFLIRWDAPQWDYKRKLCVKVITESILNASMRLHLINPAGPQPHYGLPCFLYILLFPCVVLPIHLFFLYSDCYLWISFLIQSVVYYVPFLVHSPLYIYVLFIYLSFYNDFPTSLKFHSSSTHDGVTYLLLSLYLFLLF